jgi:hypothetical protein
VAGQVLEISKHDNTSTARQLAHSGRTARLYRFPSLPPLAAAAQKPQNVAPKAPERRFQLHLAVEVAIGLVVWLIWLLWRTFH